MISHVAESVSLSFFFDLRVKPFLIKILLVFFKLYSLALLGKHCFADFTFLVNLHLVWFGS